MAGTSILSAKIQCIVTVQALNCLGQVAKGSFNNEMIMVGHQNKRIDYNPLSAFYASDDFIKADHILNIYKYSFSAVSQVHDVIKCTFIFYSLRSCHETIKQIFSVSNSTSKSFGSFLLRIRNLSCL